MGSIVSNVDVENVGVIDVEDGNRATTGAEAKETTDQASGGNHQKQETLAPKDHNDYERFVREWLSELRKHNPFADYDRICAMEASKPALKWLAHPKLHRHPDYKAFDSNLAAFSTEDDFWNASVVTLSENPNHKVILAQLPDLTDTDQMKSFWNTVKANNATSVHILGDSLELANIAKLFVTDIGSCGGQQFFYHGKKKPQIFVETRKVEVNGYDDKEPGEMIDNFTVDIMEVGDANALRIDVYSYPPWARHCGPNRHSTALRAAIIINDDLAAGKTVLITSAYGAGRPGTLLALAAALRAVSHNKFPNLAQIITSIREQRPMAVDSMKQVLTLYGAVFCYLINCPASETLSDQDELAEDFIDWESDMFDERLRRREKEE